MNFSKLFTFIWILTFLLIRCSTDKKQTSASELDNKDTVNNLLNNFNGIDTVIYRTGYNDQADIWLSLNPDNTLNFYFKSFPYKDTDEDDTLVSSDEREIIFESIGTWRAIGDDIEVVLKKSTEINYRDIFLHKENNVLAVSDSIFKFNKDTETIILWGIKSDKKKK